ncbi:MAG: hypothetical protein AMS20_03135 [Gemmatimonas sp. SG8_28]|jgi:hypothetical protein|nr:MAG: hypothetical protein AMS20_03135 [Gemmatimonas sp. SG8_28]
MQTNVGRVDAWVRGGLAIAFLVIAALLNGDLVLSLTAVLFAILFGGTALTHACPVYTILGISTRAHRHPST